MNLIGRNTLNPCALSGESSSPSMIPQAEGRTGRAVLPGSSTEGLRDVPHQPAPSLADVVAQTIARLEAERDTAIAEAHARFDAALVSMCEAATLPTSPRKKDQRHRGLTARMRQWLEARDGEFTYREVADDLGVTTNKSWSTFYNLVERGEVVLVRERSRVGGAAVYRKAMPLGVASVVREAFGGAA